MAKKSFKENNPAMQFITPPKEILEDQPQKSTRKSKDAKENKGSDKVEAVKEGKVKEGKVKKAKVKEAKVKEAKVKEENIVQMKENDKEKRFPRIDSILTEDNLRYLNNITRSEGVSVSDYINKLVNEDQAKSQS
ncbi:MAG: hypothetical protein AWM53_01871 [Candidatus Dichloromethanomonas elyunquensis]|nr:MAG: hypothetical protein AWM53_01871 [Candidatus Dichloromethanomonas elyunquensis]